MNLSDCLQRQSLRMLEAIGRARGFTVPVHTAKEKTMAALVVSLLDETAMRTIWNALTDDARAVLRDLARCANPIREQDFIHRYGRFRPYKPWQPDAPRQPWSEPISPAETLIYAGLLYPVNLGTTGRPIPVIILPDEISDALDEYMPFPKPGPVAVSGVQTPTPAGTLPVHKQVFALLSFLNAHDVRPQWERWLPPRIARDVAGRLSISVEDKQTARGRKAVPGERQIPRLAFIHYLAERANLVGPASGSRYLKPTLAVHGWLHLPPFEQSKTLWDAWQRADKDAPGLWRRYDLPVVGTDDPLPRFRDLVTALNALEPQQAVSLPAFLDTLAHHNPALFRPYGTYYDTWQTLSGESREQVRACARRCLRDLLVGPLAWFGAVKGEGVTEKGGRAASLSLTPLGAALLYPKRESSTQNAALLEVESEHACPVVAYVPPDAADDASACIIIRAFDHTPFSVLWTLDEIATPMPEQVNAYRLDRRTFLRALDRGYTVEDVVERLEQDSGDPLSPLVLHLLYTWAEDHEQVTIRQVTILETRDAGLLGDLSRVKRIRARFTGTLSARAVTVDASAVPLLVRQIEKRGLHATVKPPVLSPVGGSPPPQEKRAAADRTAIVAAMDLAARIARELGLRLHIPYPLIDDWKSSLALAERDAAEAWVSEAVRRWEAGRRRDVDACQPPFPVAPYLPALQKAIADQATIEVAYHKPGYPPSTRELDPLRLEQLGRLGTWYLVAFCHLRGEERMFRVDRMAGIEQAAYRPESRD